ncbi:hypothetical protein Ade02nite_74960 [Paractinoplanes deccanensis]|uniref:Uncharacterized protein n=1 Tax=Paractinoplanes deccanensis TaxID=113561 RepID=A0ABQ3YGE1_9ACTN|nr:hypothetical protein [Actinoplanes deccanensis]GID78855.1 hypothetical protein Ade02nite_74960 [Actinoplanes deccanensis]
MIDTQPHLPALVDRPGLLLLLAGVCLLVALRFAGRAVRPVGAIIQSAAAAVVVIFAVSIAFVLVVAVAVTR